MIADWTTGRETERKEIITLHTLLYNKRVHVFTFAKYVSHTSSLFPFPTSFMTVANTISFVFPIGSLIKCGLNLTWLRIHVFNTRNIPAHNIVLFVSFSQMALVLGQNLLTSCTRRGRWSFAGQQDPGSTSDSFCQGLRRRQPERIRRCPCTGHLGEEWRRVGMQIPSTSFGRSCYSLSGCFELNTPLSWWIFHDMSLCNNHRIGL